MPIVLKIKLKKIKLRLSFRSVYSLEQIIGFIWDDLYCDACGVEFKWLMLCSKASLITLSSKSISFGPLFNTLTNGLLLNKNCS